MTGRQWINVGLLLTPGIGLILVFMGGVLYLAAAQSFGYYDYSGSRDGFTLEFWANVSERRAYFRSVRYSLAMGFISAILSVALAYPLALWLRKPFKGSHFISAVLKAPLLVHGLVAAFLYINIIAYHGIINQMMIGLGIWDEPIRMQNDNRAIGVIILQTWKNMPFALLLLSGAVQSISDDVLNAARDLGAGAYSRFWKVIAPLSVSAIQAALIIIFIAAMADFSFQTIAGPTNRQSLAEYMTFFSASGRWNHAAVIAVTMMILSLFGAIALTLLSRFVFGSKR